MKEYISNVKSPKISIAPMVDVTNRHFRYFMRILSKEALLYTEMITAKAILNSDSNHLDYLLGFNKEEGMVALQIAASNPQEAYQAVKLAENYPYSEINLNCGCPSDRVSGNLMGAALMSNKELVYEILMAMKEATDKPVTIKHRIGIDGTGVIEDHEGQKILEGYEDLLNFLSCVSKAKPDRYTIHARTAILKGLNPKQNRQIPPLDYDMVYQIKKDFPYLNIEINGGFKTIETIQEALTKVDSVMLGRVAYENCYLLTQLDNLVNESVPRIGPSRKSIIRAYLPYLIKELKAGTNIYVLTAPMQSLFHGQRNSKLFRQLLSAPNLKNTNVNEIFQKILEEC